MTQSDYRADRLEQALKRVGEVTDERFQAAKLAWIAHSHYRRTSDDCLHAALTAALAIQPKGDGEPAGQDGWQPIATASTDGTRLWLYFPGGAPDDRQTVGWWREYIDGGRWCDHADTERDEPTHWRPLPAPPDTGDR